MAGSALTECQLPSGATTQRVPWTSPTPCTWPTEEWEGPQAVEVVAVVSAVGGLLYEIHDRGATVFDALSGEDRNRLLRASELIEAVARPSRDLKMHAQNETSP